MKKINDLGRFSVVYHYDKLYGEVLIFKTLEEAENEFNEISKVLLRQTERLESSHWRKGNKEGLWVELRELRALPQSVINEINEAEPSEEDWGDILHTYSTRLKTHITYLSDDWNEETGEFEIKEKFINGCLYNTLPFSEKCVNLETGEEVTLNGAIS